MGRFTGDTVTFALYLGLSMLAGMTVREYVRATVAARLGDPTPRLWGRLSLDPRALVRARSAAGSCRG